jgi:hypothetical protein
VRAVADELGVPCIERHMPTMLVEDFGVLYPSGDKGTLSYRLPDWFPVKGKAPERGILLFDDRNQAGSELQKVLANICQARTLHGTAMPDGWMVVSTGNRQSDRAGANRVLTHLRNRETVLDLETHLDDWTKWASEHGVRPEVISFVHFRPNLLHNFDPQKDQNPTLRSWVEGVSAVLGVVPPEAEYECFKGAVGEAAANEFVGFLRVYRNLPALEDIADKPETVPVPKCPATLYALVGALTHHATAANFAAYTTYVTRMQPEFGVLFMNCIVRRDRSLTQNAAFSKWVVKNHNILF